MKGYGNVIVVQNDRKNVVFYCIKIDVLICLCVLSVSVWNLDKVNPVITAVVLRNENNN